MIKNANESRANSTGHLSSVNVASTLCRDIVEGRYTYGEQLPPERVLADNLGTSRGTIRSALATLEETGMVERKRGSGTFVRHRVQGTQEYVAEITSPLELISVRLAVEPPMIRMATVNASSRDLESLEQALLAVETIKTDAEVFSKFDEQFHLCLAEITRNPLMVWLYRHLNEVRGQSQWHRAGDKILNQESIEAYNIQHRRMFEAIRDRDSREAETIITEHLELARQDLVGARMSKYLRPIEDLPPSSEGAGGTR